MVLPYTLSPGSVVPGSRAILAQTYDIAVVGAGIVGLATARALLRRRRRSLVVLEAEANPGAHQTSHNSGVIHAGVYYRPGSRRARLCAEGREALYRMCRDRGLPYRQCSKLIIATEPDELPLLDEYLARARANGLSDVRRIGPEEIHDCEPHAAGLAALHVPETGVVDFLRVARELARSVYELGGKVHSGSPVVGVENRPDAVTLTTPGGEVAARTIVNCAGLQSDRVAKLAGVRSDVRIVPFRGEYLSLAPERAHLVRSLIYPVPRPGLPFLGVHFTRLVNDRVEVGPNALLALNRHAYDDNTINWPDAINTLTWPGFWRLAWRYWRESIDEYRKARSPTAMAKAMQRLIPEITTDDLRPGRAGVRAQALDRAGNLVDDFRIVTGPRMVHVLNAPSPAATAALAIGDHIARLVDHQ